MVAGVIVVADNKPEIGVTIMLLGLAVPIPTWYVCWATMETLV